jgi:hypothetical protein
MDLIKSKLFYYMKNNSKLCENEKTSHRMGEYIYKSFFWWGISIQLLNYNETTSLKNGEVSANTLHQKHAKSNTTHK